MLFRDKWSTFLDNIITGPSFNELGTRLNRRTEEGATIYPNSGQLFRAFSFFDPEETKVVIIGQDPYHGEGQADGLAFSVSADTQAPPSLRNIFKELHSDLGIEREFTDLQGWAQQGVLLLNTVLTVEKGVPNSHQGIGWELFTDAVIAKLAKLKPLIFVLWGKRAESKLSLIAKSGIPDHRVITSPHPSPFSADKGFFGSKPFSRINQFLDEMGEKPIDWGRKL